MGENRRTSNGWKSTGVRVVGKLTFDKRFDELNDLALLMTRQATHLLEDLPDLAGRPALPGGLLLDTEQMLDGHVKNRCKAGELIRTQRDVVAFPCRISRLLHTELVGKLRLRETEHLPRLKEALTERRPRP